MLDILYRMKHISRSIPKIDFGHSFLFGPRGTGKSTWLKRTYPDGFYIVLMEQVDFRTYFTHPENLESDVKAQFSTLRGTVIIDEIQRVPSLLPVVHRLIELYKGIRFILAGSSARKLRQGNIDLLGGRAVQNFMHPYIASELGEAFNLETALEYGLVPLIVSSPNQAKQLNGIPCIPVDVFLKDLRPGLSFPK